MSDDELDETSFGDLADVPSNLDLDDLEEVVRESEEAILHDLDA